jgi:hypothetical protein
VTRVLVVVAACGVPAQPPQQPPPPEPIEIMHVEWRARVADADHVAIAFVVDGGVHELGTLDGTPESCALRRADVRGTDIVCANGTFFAAAIEQDKLVVRDASHVVAQLFAGNAQLIVAPYRLPIGP